MAPSSSEGTLTQLRWRTLAAMALLACAVTVLEIAFMRIFSFTIWHHFASMVISVALLGFSVAGIALHVRPGLGQPGLSRAAWYAGSFGVAAIAAAALVARVPFNPTRITQEPVQLLYLAAHYAALLVPFTLAGLAIVTLLNGFAGSVGRLYASDLLGAGLGCFVVVFSLPWLGAEGAVFLAAVLAAASACLLWIGSPGARARGAVAWLALAGTVVVLLPASDRIIAVRPGHGKILGEILNRAHFPEARLAFTRWSALARIDVVEKSGLIEWIENSHANVAPPPVFTQLVIDGDAATPIVPAGRNAGDLAFLDYTLSSAAVQAFRPEHGLVIGAGGGVDVLTLVRNGAARVDGVEINPIIAGLVRGRYAEESGGLFARNNVVLHVGEGRSFVRRSQDRYDLIQLSLIDTWAASASGAYSLSEGYLYTVEAFQDYLDHLTDNGVLTITRWLWQPPRETLKLCTVANEALRRAGVDRPGDHIAVLVLDAMGSVLIKRTPFTPGEIERLTSVAQARHFDFLHLPGHSADNPFSAYFASDDPDAFLASYAYDMTPSTDESPYFFQFGRWRDAYPWSHAWNDSLLALSGRLVLVSILTQAVVFCLLFLVVPLVMRRASRPGRTVPFASTLAYFFLVGISFMLLEITLMQRFTLFLGHPQYAITLVLAVLLVAAGVGSLCSSRLASGTRSGWWIFGSIGALVVAYTYLLPVIFRWALVFDLSARLALGAALIFPLGFLLGLPFPAGIARLSRAGAGDQVGAAWAANGFASVIGPVLAVLLAMDFGFRVVMIAAAVGYAAAGVFFAPRARESLRPVASDGLRAP